jgi:hypothetical protein
MKLFKWYSRKTTTGIIEYVFPFFEVNPSDPGVAYFQYTSNDSSIGMDATSTPDFENIYTKDKSNHEEKIHGMIYSLFTDLYQILEYF